MPKLKFGDAEKIKERDDFCSFYTDRLWKKMKKFFREDGTCDECRRCELFVITILFDSDGDEVLVWDSPAPRGCMRQGGACRVFLTYTNGKPVFTTGD